MPARGSPYTRWFPSSDQTCPTFSRCPHGVGITRPARHQRWYTDIMSDTSGHDATRHDQLHTMTVRELEAKIKAAGIVMSDRQVVRHCKAGTFDALKIPAANNVEQWFIAPSSVEKGIA